MTAGEIAAELDRSEDAESVFAILRHLAANPDRGVRTDNTGTHPDSKFYIN